MSAGAAYCPVCGCGAQRHKLDCRPTDRIAAAETIMRDELGSSPLDLVTDPQREDAHPTGILVRARRASSGDVDNVDIAELDARSARDWLLSRGSARWPTSVALLLLGHGPARIPA